MLKKDISRAIQDLYLYPCSKGENVIRSIAWIISWVVGIVLQGGEDLRALGGAYLIFAISLLLEFVPIKKNALVSRFVYGLLCIMQILILIGSLPMIFGNISSTIPENEAIYVLMGIVPCLGWIVIIAIFIIAIFDVMDLHKYFYDGEAEAESKKEEYQNEFLKIFYDSLNGESFGGDEK